MYIASGQSGTVTLEIACATKATFDGPSGRRAAVENELKVIGPSTGLDGQGKPDEFRIKSITVSSTDSSWREKKKVLFKVPKHT